MSRSLRESSLLNTTDYRSLSVGSVPTNEYLITSTVLNQSETNVTFDVSGLGDTYRHLQLAIVGRTDRASTSDSFKLQFNADTGANYSYHRLFGNGSVADAEGNSSQAAIDLNRVAGNTAASDIYGASIIEITDAFNTNKNTTIRNLSGVTGSSINLDSGLWMNTNALTEIKILPGAGTNWLSGSRFSLYGVTA
jgi:hypothetical protein